MRLLIQRVHEGSVSISNRIIASIGTGLVILIGFGPSDTLSFPKERLWTTLQEKIATLRIFPDAEDKMNLGLEDYGGELLLVSQFTLYADSRKGKRPSFHLAAAPEIAKPLFQHFVDDLKKRLPGRVQQGVFGADMDIRLVNWGPVTLFWDSDFF